LITLAVHPEVSTITSFLTVGTFALPQTSTRFVDTVLRVKDGEQIAIGGLVRSEEFRNRQMVPFLSRLPVIGALFQSDSKQRRNSEVIVLLTARQLKD
jgi:type IV pilus assembly protein PilQ